MRVTKYLRAMAVTVLIALFIGILLILFLPTIAFAEIEVSNGNVFKGRGYDLDDETIHNRTKILNYVDDAPSITIFVHGQGGNASHWSNDRNGNFAYDQNSLPEKIHDNNNSTMYLAKVKNYENENERKQFYLLKLEKNDNNTNLYKQEFVTKITDVSKHLVVIFESAKPNLYHRYVYEELHTVIDRISYDVLCLTGRIPIVNLISHSRGGIVSMMYATGYRQGSKTAEVEYYDKTCQEIYPDRSYSNTGELIHDHPFNVGALYSFGTPYKGTKLDKEWAKEFLPDAFGNASAGNILDIIIQEEIKYNWEYAVTTNPNLTLYANAGEISLNFILGLLVENRIKLSNNLVERNVDIDFLLKDLYQEQLPMIIQILHDIKVATATAAAGSVIVSGGLSIVVYSGLAVACNELESNANYIKEQIDKIFQQDSVVGKLEVLDNILIHYYDFLNDFVEKVLKATGSLTDLYSFSDIGDLFIDSASQQADGFVNVQANVKIFNYESVSVIESEDGLKFQFVKPNFSFDKSAVNDVSIVHNLEPYDTDLQNEVLNNIICAAPRFALTCDEMDDGTLKVTGIDTSQCPDDINLDFSLENIIGGKSISSIASGAFVGLTNLKSLVIPNSVTMIENGAFAGCNNLNIHISAENNNFVVVDNILYNKNQTKIIASGKISANVTVPSTVTEIAPSAFEGNVNLQTLDFGKTVPNIGERAFADCVNLKSAYFYSYNEPVCANEGFAGCSFTAFAPYLSLGDYAMLFERYDVDVTSVQTVLSYVSDGQVIRQEKVYYGSELHNLYLPTRDGYAFRGWYRDSALQGDCVQDGVLWEETADASLYADWRILTYSIYYNLNGGVNSPDNPNEYTVVDLINLSAPVKTGYSFVGWTSGGQAVNGIDKGTFGDVVFDANWQANDYVLSFDVNGGTPFIEPITVTYGQSFNIGAVPVKSGYYLDGWYLDGIKYANADGSSANPWSIADNATLTAKWLPKWYTIKIGQDGKIWLNAQGALVGNPSPVLCGTGLDLINAIKVFKDSPDGFRTGMIFDRFEYDNETVNWSDGVPDLGENGSEITIEPCWVLESYTITFQTRCEHYVTKIVAQYGAQITLPTLNCCGLSLDGWFTQLEGGEQVYWTVMPDLTPAEQNNGSCELFAHRQVINYIIDYQLGGGTNSPDNTNIYNCKNNVTFKEAARTGYTFDGWYLDEAKTVRIESTHNCYENLVIYAKWIRNKYKVTLDLQGGETGNKKVTASYGKVLKTLAVPTRTGYTFQGYYTQPQGKGTQYYDSTMTGIKKWKIANNDQTLYAYWTPNVYTVTFYNSDETAPYNFDAKITYGQAMPRFRVYAPDRKGYEFVGYYEYPNGEGRQYYSMYLYNDQQAADEYGCQCYYVEAINPRGSWDIAGDATLYAHWKLLECDYNYENYWLANGVIGTTSVHLKHGHPVTLTAATIEGYEFKYFSYKFVEYPSATVTFEDIGLKRNIYGDIVSQEPFIAVYEQSSCVAEGTLITLADGTQVPVESLTGEETLLVWNMMTGQLDSAKILFIDKDAAQLYKVINLGFSDGTAVKVISEHAFWDCDLNGYVYLSYDASKYIGHWFAKQDGKAQLTSVEVREEYTATYSPVTYGHLCYYVNGMLSIPGGISGLFNIFEVDPETMTVDSEAMEQDISKYGLFTYEEFSALLPVSQYVFDAFNGQYLKVAIGKGLIDMQTLTSLVQRYSVFFQ